MLIPATERGFMAAARLAAGKKRQALEVSVDAAMPSSEPRAPTMPRLSTPDCMSSPVSHLRAITSDLEEDAKRRKAAQYLREVRASLWQKELSRTLDFSLFTHSSGIRP